MITDTHPNKKERKKAMARRNRKEEVDTARSPQGSSLLDKIRFAGLSVIACATVGGGQNLLAIEVGRDQTLPKSEHHSYYDIPELMSMLLEAGFSSVPVGISSELPLRKLPRTVLFLRQVITGEGLGNYLIYDGNQTHRPLPVMGYSQLRVSDSERIIVVVSSGPDMAEELSKFVPNEILPEEA